jgi:hypothetical protein
MLLAFSRPFWPLFLHVLGAMTLFGGVLAAAFAAFAGHRSATFWALVISIPDWIVMRIGAAWIYSDEQDVYHGARWVAIGSGIADGGLIVFLGALAVAFWWRRGGPPLAGRIAGGLCGVYLVLLAVAWLAMTGKWG